MILYFIVFIFLQFSVHLDSIKLKLIFFFTKSPQFSLNFSPNNFYSYKLFVESKFVDKGGKFVEKISVVLPLL